MLITRFDCSISKTVTKKKQHGNKQQKKTSFFFDHLCTFAYDSKISIFAVERGIFIYPTYLLYSHAGSSVRKSHGCRSMLSVHHEFKDCNVFAFKHVFKINWLINKLHQKNYLNSRRVRQIGTLIRTKKEKQRLSPSSYS